MKTWHRTGLYLLRKKERSILLIFLIFVMGTFVFAGSAMKACADREIAEIRRQLGSSFVISEDLENSNLYEMKYEDGYQYTVFTGRPVTGELIEDVLQVEGIAGYETSSSEIVWTNLKLRPGLWAVSEENEYADNFLYIDSYTGMELKKNRSADQGQEVYSEATFFVEDPQNLEAVMKRVKEQVDLSNLIVSLDDSAYQASVKPLRQIGIFARILLISGVLGCLAILGFLLKLWTGSRTHEIGILLSIGINRKKVLWQILLETMILASVSIILISVCAPFFTNAFFHASVEITAPDQKEEHYTIKTKRGEYLPTVSQVSIEEVNLTNTYTWAEAAWGIGLIYGCSLISALSASAKIMKFTPGILLQSR